MADYFTSFTLVAPLPDEAAQQYAFQLSTTISDAGRDDTLPDNVPQSIRDEMENWSFNTVAVSESHGIWLHSKFGGIDAVCAFIQHLLRKFTPEAIVTFEWSHDYSKPLTDAYGGGAAIITATEIKTMSTSEWLQLNAA